jgi:hypothetical protein|tara:strand:+ start:295 stop:3111 length:2817 start_codon:yes stop_codon:yes gene_type:complete
MDTKTFLERALRGAGRYCMFAAHSEDKTRIQKFYSSVDELKEAADTFDARGYDVYFALAVLGEDDSRKVSNVKTLSSFFLDLDCGPSKDFPTQADALNELKEFCKATKLPKPFILDSGRGIHVYWFLTEPVARDDWVPVAEKLKRLCAEYEFAADPAVTADAARVLRPIGTHNHKTSPPSRVDPLLQVAPAEVDFDKFNELLGGDLILPPKKFTPSTPSVLMESLMGNRETYFRQILEKIDDGSGCEQLRIIYTDQENCSEPMWRAGLSIAKFCTDGDKAIHKLSVRHPEYSAHGTVEKVNLIKGPYLCTKFDEFNPKVCKNCKHWKKIKSPITLGNTILEATAEDNIVEAPSATLANADVQTYTIPPYPKPYFRGANGGIYIRSVSIDGEVEERNIYHNDLYVVKRIRDAEIGEAVFMRLHLPKDGVSEFTIPLTSVTSREEFRKSMSMRGVTLTKMDEIMQYTTTWVNELQARETADEAYRQFGWAGEDMDTFILGNQKIYKDRIDFNPPASTTIPLFPAFEPKGSLEEWKEMANFLNVEGQEPYQYVMGASFGSALMELTPVACSSLHIHSKDSGLGKTTALEAALTVWGDPKELLLGKEDTYKSKMNRGEIYHSIPLFLDEITNLKSHELSDLAYQYVSGRQRRRLDSNAKEKPNGVPWSFTSITTGNVSVIERIMLIKDAPKAEAQRILEFKVDRLFKDSASKLQTDKWAADVQRNYGHAGVLFVQHVMNNREEVTRKLEEVQQRIDREAGLTAENRFWSAGAACTMTALILCKRMGLLQYDTERIYRWIIRLLKVNKNTVHDMQDSVEQTLNDYVHENWNNILWIRSTEDRRGKADTALDELVVPDATPRIGLVARYETDVKRLYLVPKSLKSWCIKQQINYASFVEDLKNKLGAKRVQKRLSKGTHMRLSQQSVLMVQFDVEDAEEELVSE